MTTKPGQWWSKYAQIFISGIRFRFDAHSFFQDTGGDVLVRHASCVVHHFFRHIHRHFGSYGQGNGIAGARIDA